MPSVGFAQDNNKSTIRLLFKWSHVLKLTLICEYTNFYAFFFILSLRPSSLRKSWHIKSDNPRQRRCERFCGSTGKWQVLHFKDIHTINRQPPTWTGLEMTDLQRSVTNINDSIPSFSLMLSYGFSFSSTRTARTPANTGNPTLIYRVIPV